MNKSIVTLIKNDLKFIAAQKCRNGRTGLLKGILSPSFICSFIYRVSHLLHCWGIPIIPKVFWWINIWLFSSDIDYRAKLYCAIYMPHPLGIVIGHQAMMNGTVKIMQGVTIGGNLGAKKLINSRMTGQPVFSGNIFVGPNSAVLGPVELTGQLFVGALNIISSSFEGNGLIYKNELRELKPEHVKELVGATASEGARF